VKGVSSWRAIWQSHRRRKSAVTDHAWDRGNSQTLGACTFNRSKLTKTRHFGGGWSNNRCGDLQSRCEELLSKQRGIDGSEFQRAREKRLHYLLPEPSLPRSRRSGCVHCESTSQRLMSDEKTPKPIGLAILWRESPTVAHLCTPAFGADPYSVLGRSIWGGIFRPGPRNGVEVQRKLSPDRTLSPAGLSAWSHNPQLGYEIPIF